MLTVVLSLDFELAWGSLDCDPSRYAREEAAALWTHETGAPWLLERLEERRLSATWATVGAMFLSEIREEHLAHARQSKGIDRVRVGIDALQGRQWLAPEFTHRLQNSAQELGFHGWSHRSFYEDAMTAEDAEREFELCREVADERGFAGRSFVFPRNHLGHIGQLAKHGFGVYRGIDTLFASGRRGRSLEMLGAETLGVRPRRSRVRTSGGLVNVPGSAMVRFARGWRAAIPERGQRRRLANALRVSGKPDHVMHIWFHPINLYDRWPRMQRIVLGLLNDLAELRNQGRIEVRTMGSFAEAPRPQPKQEKTV